VALGELHSFGDSRMTPSEAEIQELQKLEREADDLLTQIAASSEVVTRQSIERLECITERAAKIAYGTGNPELISEQMSTLITWTDHLDDDAWILRFREALGARPLVSPWK
jgi:hypothetical protein